MKRCGTGFLWTCGSDREPGERKRPGAGDAELWMHEWTGLEPWRRIPRCCPSSSLSLVLRLPPFVLILYSKLRCLLACLSLALSSVPPPFDSQSFSFAPELLQIDLLASLVLVVVSAQLR